MEQLKKEMAYTKRNQLQRMKLVQELVQKHYEPGISTYKGVWRKYINPVYPMCYATFLKIINTPIKREFLEKKNHE